MSYVSVLLTFALVHWLAAASPGPNFVLVSSAATQRSRLHGMLAGAGIVLGTLTWSSAAALGLGVVIQQLPAVYSAIQYVGALYLIWLGSRMIVSAIRGSALNETTDESLQMSMKSTILTGYLVNMTNPKSIAYWTSLYAVVIPADAPTFVFVAAIAVACTVSALWWSVVACTFSLEPVRGAFRAFGRWFDGLAGAALVFLGVRMASGR